MDEPIPRQTRVVRKSAFGRTSLFLPSKDVLFREVKCTGSIVKHEGASIYHMHNLDGRENVVCWHCCEEFKGDGIPLPRLYDPVEHVYHVYGKFCSPNCGKAYLLEHTTFDRGQHMNVFVRMLREVYNITERIIEAPPRISLKKFGGMFAIEQFRNVTNVCTVHQPPFVSYCMIVEERLPQHSIGEVSHPTIDMEICSKTVSEDNFISKPQEKPMYEDFVKNKPTEQGSTSRKRKEPATSSSSSGSLTRYVTKQTDTSR